MAKILISSSTLAKALSEIAEGDYVSSVVLNLEQISLITNNKKTIRISAHTSSNCLFAQDHKRWDSLYQVVKVIPEQPIILDVYDNVLNLIIQF